MNEKFPENNQEHSVEEEIRTRFNSAEKRAISEAVGFWENLDEEKVKHRAARTLLALALFAGVSSAFAEEQVVGEEEAVQTEEQLVAKNQVADFDWKKIVGKIEVSASGTTEKINDYDIESIRAGHGLNNSSRFYKGVDTQEIDQAYSINQAAISGSKNSAEFFENLATATRGLSDKQKAAALQQLGALLGNTYNYDMLEADQHIVVSDDAMLQALKDGSESGMCGNIHTFLVEAAQAMGVEAFLQSGQTQGGGHVWAGLVLGDGNEKEIVFLDYGTLIPTGTLNYRDALGIAERYHGDISLFNNYVGNEDETLFPVKSRAQEVVERASGITSSSTELEQNLAAGEIKNQDRGIEVVLSPEIKELGLSTDSIGLAFFKFDDAYNNPYQAIRDLSATRLSVGLNNENFELKGDVTVLNMNIKDINDGTVSINDLVGSLAGNYVDKKQLTKNDYGQFVASWGATLMGATRIPLDEQRKAPGDIGTSNIFEGSFGGRVVYIDPNNSRSFYVEVLEQSRAQTDNLQEQKTVIKSVSEKITAGALVKVYEGSVISGEVTESNNEWGKGFGVNIGVAGEKLKGEVIYEKNSSDYERYVPTSEKVGISISYQGGPRWEVDVIGAKTTEKYKDAGNNDNYSAEVKLRILLW